MTKPLVPPESGDEANSSEELWRSLVQNVADLIVTTDLEGRITFSNRPVAGETRHQVMGREIFEFLATGERDRVKSSLQMMLSRSLSLNLEARGRLIGTEETWYSIRAAAIKGDAQPKGMILICTDIGVRKALQLEAERFRLMMDHARKFIWVVAPDGFGRILDFNTEVTQMLGYDAAEVRRQRFVDYLESPNLTSEPAWADHLRRSKDKSSEFVTTGRLKRKDGSTFPIELFSTFVDVGGQEYLLAMAQDLTEKLRLETALEEQRARVAFSSKMATLGEMAGGIAHEINNPVTIIDGYAQQLSVWVDQEPFDKLRVKVQAKKISDTVMRIARIVRGLRTFSRDGTHDPLQHTVLKSLVDDTLGLCTEKFRLADIKLTTPTAAELDCAIDCRPTEISQVLLNLLFNGRDAVKDLSEKWVKLEVVDVAEFLEISVTDSGTGIPKEIRNRMMQPFFTTKDVGQGTGLGLSISRGIVEAHGGRLYYDEKSPHTRFVVVLPKHKGVLKNAG